MGVEQVQDWKLFVLFWSRLWFFWYWLGLVATNFSPLDQNLNFPPIHQFVVHVMLLMVQHRFRHRHVQLQCLHCHEFDVLHHRWDLKYDKIRIFSSRENDFLKKVLLNIISKHQNNQNHNFIIYFWIWI